MSADVGTLAEWQSVTLRAMPSLAAYVVGRLCTRCLPVLILVVAIRLSGPYACHMSRCMRRTAGPLTCGRQMLLPAEHPLTRLPLSSFTRCHSLHPSRAVHSVRALQRRACRICCSGLEDQNGTHAVHAARQDGFLGLRCAEAQGRYLQARRRAPHRLCFFSEHWGVWEQWQACSPRCTCLAQPKSECPSYHGANCCYCST